MTLDDMVDKGNATSLSSQRTIADTSEIRVTVEAVAMEHSHHTLVLHPSVCHDGIEYDLTVLVHILKRVPRDVLQEFGNREQGTRA